MRDEGIGKIMMNKPEQDTPQAQLVEQGSRKIRWARLHQRLLQRLQAQFRETQPFAGLTIGMCLHVEPKTAVLCLVLQAGGANVVITGSPGTTKDDVVAALRQEGIIVYGQQHDDMAAHQDISSRCFLTILIFCWITGLILSRPISLIQVRAASSLARKRRRRAPIAYAGNCRAVSFPIIVINDSPLKLIIENEHGVGPTIVEGFMRETNLLVQSRSFVVFGYGSVGRGIARCLRRLGAQVTVVELDPIRALEAALDGMRVTTLEEALGIGEVFFTATGRPGVIAGEVL